MEDDNSATLKRIKRNISDSRESFYENYQNFHEMMRFVFDTSVSEDESALLNALQKPDVEFNFLEAYISRLLGEFAKSEPSFIIGSDELGMVDPQVIKIVEGHIRHIFRTASENSFDFDVYREMLGGGYSVGKIWTEYESPYSFEHKICVGKVFDPTLTGFDPLAKLSSKSDGAFCYELFPIRKRQLKELLPKIKLDAIKASDNIGGFSWSYNNQKETILMYAYYYEKIKKNKKLVLLSNGKRMFLDDYKKRVDLWSHGAHIDQPAVVIDERSTEITKVLRYELIENQLIDCKETDFTSYPLTFFDANSVIVKETENSSSIKQKTRPYIYQAVGIQKLKNFTGQSLASEYENLVQHKYLIPVEGMVENDIESINDIQKLTNIQYYAFKRDQSGNVSDVQIPPPTLVNRQDVPPSLVQTFFDCEKGAQSILGNYDAALGVNDNTLSGRAIIASATQSNATAMPIIFRYLQGITNMAQTVVDLLPSINRNPRSLLTSEMNGKTEAVGVNRKDAPSINYLPQTLKVTVKAGTNFEVQQQQAMQSLFVLSKELPWFGQLLQEEGMEVVLENINFRGSDILKKAAPAFMQKVKAQAAQQQQMQQMQMQNSPQAIKAKVDMASVQQKAKDDDEKNQLEIIQKGIDNKELDIELMRVKLEEKESEDMDRREQERHDSEIEQNAHKHALEISKHLHDVKYKNEASRSP